MDLIYWMIRMSKFTSFHERRPSMCSLNFCESINYANQDNDLYSGNCRTHVKFLFEREILRAFVCPMEVKRFILSQMCAFLNNGNQFSVSPLILVRFQTWKKMGSIFIFAILLNVGQLCFCTTTSVLSYRIMYYIMPSLGGSIVAYCCETSQIRIVWQI